MRWSAADEVELRRLWDIHGGGFRKIAAVMGRTRGSIDGKSRVLGLQFHGGRSRTLNAGDNAAREGRTVFPGRVVAPSEYVLKSGDNQRKLGRVVKKGAWKGMPIYSLTLEERATCPRSCKQWLNCYGNNMGRSVRYRHGAALEGAIATDLAQLDRKHPDGFVVRLHILGDFYSTEYVEFWRTALQTFPALRVFGYSARQASEPIGQMIADLRDECWDRFAVRTSGAQSGPRTVVGESQSGAITCPAQTGKTSHCGACALCWAPAAKDKPILFLAH